MQSQDYIESGPRFKSEATRDLENIVKAFLKGEEKIICSYNPIGELEVMIGSEKYPLTKILENQPDFEQFDLTDSGEKALDNYAEFINKEAKHKPFLLGTKGKVPTPEDYEKIRGNEAYDMSYAEKLAVTLYTTDFFKIINEFLRQNGKVKKLEKLNSEDLTKMVKEILLATCISSYALTKPTLYDLTDPTNVLPRHHYFNNMLQVITARLDEIEKEYEALNLPSKDPDLIAQNEDKKKVLITEKEELKIAKSECELQLKKYSPDQTTDRIESISNSINVKRKADIENKKVTTHAGFTSTSTRSDFNVKKKQNIFLHIRQRMAAHALGKDVSTLSSHPFESEVLYLPNQQFAFRSHTTKDGNVHFEATAVRSVNDINPFSYSRKDSLFRSELASNCLLINKFMHGGFLSRIAKTVKTFFSKKKQEDKLIFINNLMKKIDNFLNKKDAHSLEEIEKLKNDIKVVIYEANSKNADPRLRQLLLNFLDPLTRIVPHRTEELIKEKERELGVIQSQAETMNAKSSEHLVSLNDEVAKLKEDIKKKDESLSEMKEKNVGIFKHVLDSHLQHPYRHRMRYPADARIVIDSTSIERPNHGLPHTVRTTNYVPAVIDYYRQFAKEESFRKFCAKMDSTMLEKIQLAMAFTITGRESDIGSFDNPEEYKKYKANSAQNFREYAESKGMDPEEIKKFEKLIQNLGNLNFLKTATEEEKALFHIMNFSRNLDLMRCYPLTIYKAAIGLENRMTVNSSKDQRKGLDKLYTLVTASLEATGDRQMVKFENGHLKRNKVKGTEEDYDKKFIKFSGDPKLCHETCSAIVSNMYPTMMDNLYNKQPLYNIEPSLKWEGPSARMA